MRLGRWGWLDRYLPERLKYWRASIREVRSIYKQVNGRRLVLLRPRRFTEKMQWRKLFDLKSIYGLFSDKYATRSYVAERIGAGFLPKLYWVGSDPDAIPFERLTPPYVIKSTHGYEHVVIVERGGVPDVEAIREKARRWLAYNHGTTMSEPGYQHVPQRLIVEELLEGADGQPPVERKIFVFDGKVRMTESIFVAQGTRVRQTAMHTADWQALGWYATRQPYQGPKPRPQHLDEMYAAAERLAAGFDFLRVDLYDLGDSFRVGELTVYSWSGLFKFNPDEADLILGAHWHLRLPVLRALFAVLFRRREIFPPAAIAAPEAAQVAEPLVTLMPESRGEPDAPALV